MTSCQIMRLDILICSWTGLSDNMGKTQPKQLAFYLKCGGSFLVKPGVTDFLDM